MCLNSLTSMESFEINKIMNEEAQETRKAKTNGPACLASIIETIMGVVTESECGCIPNVILHCGLCLTNLPGCSK